MRRLRVPIASIHTGERVRSDVGDVSDLAESIRSVGLLHPIVIDSQGNLVAGERRLTACRILAWDMVDVSVLDNDDDLHRIDAEIQENLQRLEFSAIEVSRALVRRAEVAARLIGQEEGIEGHDAARMLHEPSSGRHAPINFGNVSERAGVTRHAVARAVQHVKAVDRYPELELAEQMPALDAARALDAADPHIRFQVRTALSAGSIKANEVSNVVQAAERATEPPPALVAQALAGGPPPVPDLDRIRLRARFIKALTVFESELALLPISNARHVLDTADIARAGRVLADFRTWHGQLAEAGDHPGVRLVR